VNIDTLAHEVIKQREASKRLFDSGDLDAWLTAMPAEFAAAERLRTYLLRHPVVVTDDPAVKQLLAETDLSEVDDPDKIGMELLWGSISPAEYATNLALVDVLVAPFNIPSDLHQFLDEARQCYAIGHSAAVQSLSRTILEAAVNDIAVRTGRMPHEAIEQDMFTEYPPKKRIRLVSGEQFEPIYQHYRDLCKVVHGLSTRSVEGPLGALTKTIGYVQYLFDTNKTVIRDAQNA
jgi:hypothetical protein